MRKVGPMGNPTCTSNYSSHMRSVAVLDRSIRFTGNEVLAIDDARTVRLIRRNPPVEITNGRDAAVNDCHSDARAIQTPLLPSRWRVDCFRSVIESRRGGTAEWTIG